MVSAISIAAVSPRMHGTSSHDVMTHSGHHPPWSYYYSRFISRGRIKVAARQGPTGLILIGAGGSHSSTEVRPTRSKYAMGCCLVLLSCQRAIWEGRISSLLGSAALRPTVTGQAGKTMPDLFRTRRIHFRLMSSPTLLIFGLSRKTPTITGRVRSIQSNGWGLLSLGAAVLDDLGHLFQSQV